jgi:hypothetical protein
VASSRCRQFARIPALCAWVAAALWLNGCAENLELSSQPDNDAGEVDSVLEKIPDSLRRDLEQGKPREVLIELNDDEPGDAGLGIGVDGSVPLASSVRGDDTPTSELVRSMAERYKQVQDRVIEQAAGSSVEVRVQYQHIPLLLVYVEDLDGLLSLVRQREVKRAHEDTLMEHQLAESLPLIKQPAVAAAGYTGAGTAVAVLDTGTDFTRAAFGSCSSAGPNCKVAYAADFGSNDGVRDATTGHGTNVSAIVLGVAPSTKILALDVFEGTTARSSTIIQAIDWVIANQSTYNIVAMNLSLGSGLFTASCSSDVFAPAIANARAAGVLSAIASGNTASSTSISSPACVPGAISVGAVYDATVGGLSYGNCSDSSTAADKVTCFSNSASFLSMLAPGAPITAGGYTMTGTSQASPHVAGAIAVTRARYSGEGLAATVVRLTSTGPLITDPRNGVQLHRLDLNEALSGVGQVDTTAPTGSVLINSGAEATRTAATMLTINAQDDSGSMSMCVSNTTTCTTFGPVTATRNWSVTTGDGMKTVYVTLRDLSGNRTTVSGTIRLDSAAPTGATLSATPYTGRVELRWTAGTDAGSGISGYRVQMATNSPPSCTAGTNVYTGTDLAFSHSGLQNNVVYAYRLCPIDRAGNVGIGTTATAKPLVEFDGPVGTVSINQGAMYTNKTAVSLTLSASDVSGIASVCMTNTTTCTSYTSYATTKTWTLGTSSGVATVRVWFKDSFGNVSAAAASDTIIVDIAPPSTNTISAVAGNATVTLGWSGSTDASSGLAGFKVMAALNTAPTCTSGTQVYSGPDNHVTHTGLTNGSVYAYRVCPFDVAGNFASGGTTTSRPAPEFDGPTGTVLINNDAVYTNNKTVTLTLTASDVSGVAAVCMSNSTTCTAYVPWATTKTWTFAATSGTATVRVWFKDSFGNVSAAPVTDTILLDLTPPTTSTLSAQASSNTVALRWTASTDAGSGFAGYRIKMAVGPAPTCTAGTQIYSGTDLSFTHSGLTNGTTYGYRVCPYDVAGNVASGSAVSASPRP